MHVEAVDLTSLVVLRGWAEVGEPDNLSFYLGDQQRSTDRRIADESGPHATTEIHRRIELGGGNQLAIANAPGLGVCLADALGVIRNGMTDDRHS